MGFGDMMFWPFGFIFGGAMILALVGLIAFIFWIWMLVDCAKRNFRNGVEKVIWILALVFGGILGALVYLIVIRSFNPHGLAKR